MSSQAVTKHLVLLWQQLSYDLNAWQFWASLIGAYFHVNLSRGSKFFISNFVWFLQRIAVNAANVDWHNFFWWEASKFRRLRNGWDKKQIWWALYKRNTRNYGQWSASKNEKVIKFEMRIFNYIFIRDFYFPQKLQNFNMNIEILRIHEGYVTTTIFTKWRMIIVVNFPI